jgi:hypothetical protein
MKPKHIMAIIFIVVFVWLTAVNIDVSRTSRTLSAETQRVLAEVEGEE